MTLPPSLHSQALSIVLVGSHNPAIFHPSWFALQGLVLDGEAEAAEVRLVSPDVTEFALDWFRLRVHQNGFEVICTQFAQYEATRDLVLGTFRVLLHTPIKQMGINHHYHFDLGSEEKWHRVGDTLAPKQFWNPSLDAPGMRRITMEGKRPDGLDGHIQVTVEPSRRVRPYGVFVSLNDHIEAGDPIAGGTTRLLDVLSNTWEEAEKRARDVASRVADLGG